jgi:alpha,alpha-trehalase
MFQEMYYWDTYFTALGLVGTRHAELALDMTENMAWLIERFGMIPNGSRYYFLSRSQPPFFTRMVMLTLEEKRSSGDDDLVTWLARMVQFAEEEHNTVWFGAAQPHHRLVHGNMSRYFDINFLDMLASAESGWDHSTRCADQWLSHLPVDLNAILYQREMDMAHFCNLLDQPERSLGWRRRAEERRADFDVLFWDEEEGYYFDYNFATLQRNPTATLAGFYPLWAGIATQAAANRVVRDWLPRFEQVGGVVTSLTPREGRQWAWPNGWAPLQYIVVEGLDRYGYHDDARRLRRKWCDVCATLFERTGALWEKYNVVDPESEGEAGLYGHVSGFGWTNGVFVDFARKLA